MSTLPSFYRPVEGELRLVEQKLAGIADGTIKSSSALLPDLVAHVLKAPGKGTRPAITLLASKLESGDDQTPVTMAAAVELLHIATLIHDDMIDNAETRRGEPTVSTTWGKNVAVLLGDYVFAASATLVCDTGNVRVIRRFSETIMELSSGELSEFTNAYNWNISRESYWKRIYEKTGSLFCTAAESGAILSGASEDVVLALKSYGYNLGLAFQVMDDILDFSGTEDEVGKPVGNDLVQGTITLPSILLIEKYPYDNPIKLFFEGVDKEYNLNRALDMISGSDIINESHEIAIGFQQQAIRSLDSLPDSVHKRCLQEIAEYSMERRK